MPRELHTATLLPDGKILIAGGTDAYHSRDSAEVYDPATQAWASAANLNFARYGHATTLLPDGRVLTVGGWNNASGTLNSAELYGSAGVANPIDEPQFFVRQQYLDFLNREPDADGLAFWTNEIISCGGDAQCIDAKRINISAAYFLSIEFQQTGYEVYRLYKAAYGDLPGAPTPLRFSEFMPDAQQIGRGVIVNQSGWEETLENNKGAFISEFVQRARFSSACPTSMSPDEFVDRLYMNAAVMPSATDRANAINEFNGALDTSDVTARARALRRVAEDPMLAQHEFNRAFVLMQYFGYLRRDPNSGPDTDFFGYNFWLNKLDAFNGDYANAEMVKAFIESTEYRGRFGP